MFVEVVRVAREMGVVRFGKLSIDGTKVRASASKRKAMSYERMLKKEAGLKEEIEGLLAKRGRWMRRRTSVTERMCGGTSCRKS